MLKMPPECKLTAVGRDRELAGERNLLVHVHTPLIFVDSLAGLDTGTGTLVERELTLRSYSSLKLDSVPKSCEGLHLESPIDG